MFEISKKNIKLRIFVIVLIKSRATFALPKVNQIKELVLKKKKLLKKSKNEKKLPLSFEL